ncbi:MAG: hypothetical protein RL318_2700, partial [Fibrobacterota bacterium]
VLWLLWRLLLGPSLAILLPASPRKALTGYLHQWRLSDLWAAPFSVIIGAMTHLACDRLAHDNHTELVPLPHGRIHLLGHEPQLWQVLQLGSSILGLALLALWFLMALRRSCPTATWTLRLWPGIARASILGILFMGPLVAAAVHLDLFTASIHDARAAFLPVIRLYLPVLTGCLFAWSVLVLIWRAVGYLRTKKG